MKVRGTLNTHWRQGGPRFWAARYRCTSVLGHSNTVSPTGGVLSESLRPSIHCRHGNIPGPDKVSPGDTHRALVFPSLQDPLCRTTSADFTKASLQECLLFLSVPFGCTPRWGSFLLQSPISYSKRDVCISSVSVTYSPRRVGLLGYCCICWRRFGADTSGPMVF